MYKKLRQKAVLAQIGYFTIFPVISPGVQFQQKPENLHLRVTGHDGSS